ncbi:MAG: hypothetical protein ACK5Y2_01375, partial [Bdellovibrionales bacterium]
VSGPTINCNVCANRMMFSSKNRSSNIKQYQPTRPGLPTKKSEYPKKKIQLLIDERSADTSTPAIEPVTKEESLEDVMKQLETSKEGVK